MALCGTYRCLQMAVHELGPPLTRTRIGDRSLERLQAVMSGRSRLQQPALARRFVCLDLA